MNHDQVNKLTQYYICFTDQLKKLDPKNSKELLRCSDGIMRVSKNIIDDRIQQGEEVTISKDSSFWALVVMCFLLFAIGMSMGIGYIAIQNLESAVFHGDFSYKPKVTNVKN